ncbi:hypothetical protein [Pseudaminobacter soli (ex Li et al. 2025)]|uniref:hypothetical protein n=1 Tax=Pseudaminobacter soli (ex Li et al. 2025) TaxID=1295366 RepID=UPI002476A1CB|nr:hypothetical protein [Mesorhizobium soli]
MPKIARQYFITAMCFLLAGVVVGLKMSISHEYVAAGAHAHTNLLGWATMAIFGTFHALNPHGAETRLAKMQYYVYTGGLIVMLPSLYLLLSGNQSLEPVVAVSSLVVFAGILMFAAIIFRARAQ